MVFGQPAKSDECFFQLLFPVLTQVSLLENESWFEIVTQLADNGKRPYSQYSL
jgi:hypothetical protein